MRTEQESLSSVKKTEIRKKRYHQIPTECPALLSAEPPAKLKKTKNGTVFLAVVSVILLAVSFYLLMDMITIAAVSASNNYEPAKNAASEAAYDAFYQQSYKASEKAHHVSNRVAITIGTLKEKSDLEVLNVSAVQYITPEEEAQKNIIANVLQSLKDKVVGDPISWLEVPGNGIFTVELTSAEFIIDDDRQYVLIRVPSPTMQNFSLDYENVHILYFEEGGAFNRSDKVGANIAQEQLATAFQTMQSEIQSNQEYYNLAKENAINLLTALVKQLNPSLNNLKVEVEFID
jgi:hypothetical protein